MTYDQIAATFSRVYKGNSNFMTPDRIRFGSSGEYIFELSSGRGISTPFLYGVTLLYRTGSKPDHDNNRCFNTRGEAEEYIDSLK